MPFNEQILRTPPKTRTPGGHRDKHPSSRLGIQTPAVPDDVERRRWHGLPPKTLEETERLWRPQEPSF